MTQKKRPSRRRDCGTVWDDDWDWRVIEGQLQRGQGHPGRVKPLFETVGEKLPYGSLDAVERSMKEFGLSCAGIYLAHDSMGCVRYAGRGSIFSRLRVRKNLYPHELEYYSFYVVKEKIHEREIETVIIRAASPLLEFNDRKKRMGISPGSVRDYEAGTYYYRRAPADARRSSDSE